DGITTNSDSMHCPHAIMCGTVTRDPELRTLPSGQPVCSYTVVPHREWTDTAGEKQEPTECLEVISFSQQAESVVFQFGIYSFSCNAAEFYGCVRTRPSFAL